MPRPKVLRPAPVGPLRLRRELTGTLVALERELDRGFGHGVLTPEDVHDLHRDLRRLVSGLTVWERLVPPSRGAEVHEATRRLRRLARLVGRVRDRDVTSGLLAPDRAPPTKPDDSPDWPAFLGRLRDDTETGRELLRAFLRTERDGGLLDRVRHLLEVDPRADADRGLWRILGDERRRRQGRVRKAHRKARRDPTSERLHRLRIRIRQWRHFSALESVSRATTHLPPPPSWRALQTRLGTLHDLDVALATIPDDLLEAGPALRLRTRRRKLRRSVRLTLEEIAARPERATARARRVA